MKEVSAAGWLSVTALLVSGTAVAQVQNPANGHYYEVVIAASISWDDAQVAAQSRFHAGVQGHLATITSSDENTFVDQLRASVLGDDSNQRQVWIGGFRDVNNVDPVFDWLWVNGEGGFPGTDSLTPFADWADGQGEPNNVNGIENHVTLGRYGLGGGWNDEGSAPNSIGGYVIEFGSTEPAQNCLEEGDGESEVDGGCNPTGVMLVQLPNDIELQEGDTLTQMLLRPDPGKKSQSPNAGACPSEFAYPDPRVDANGRPVGKLRKLNVFLELGGGPAGALILDELTYGSPCFAVIDGGANFELVDALPAGKGGVATMTQFPDDVPGIGTVFQCYHPGTNPDMQLGTQFTYQTSVRGDMVENLAAPMTKHCNSPSRGATFKFSFYVLNTHEDCGLNYDSRLGPLKVQLCFKLRALEKHYWLEQSLRNARTTVAASRYNQMTRTLNRAQLFLIAGSYTRAIAELLDFQGQVEAATWSTTLANHPGNLVMRTENLLFRAEQLQQGLDNL